jgi:GMP synthase (glutamine-hydrolysing)
LKLGFLKIDFKARPHFDFSVNKFLIIKAGEKLSSLAHMAGDFEDWILNGMGVETEEAHIVAVYLGAPLPSHECIRAVLITGSSAMVTDRADWMEHTEQWLREAVKRRISTLGICFGHQLLADALGGTVADNPHGVETGTVELRLDASAASDPLLGKLPDQMTVQACHGQVVKSLPPGAVRLARTDLDENQSFVIGGHAWGVQFHPEFNGAVVRKYVEHYRTTLLKQGRDPQQLLDTCADTPESASLLARFREYS